MFNLLESIQISLENLYKGQDDEIDSWLLMKTPVPITIILLMYLMFVFKIGPEYMKNKNSYKLNKILILYNGFQVLFSAWMATKIFLSATASLTDIFNSTCANTLNTNRTFAIEVWSAAWWYFISKIVDLLDTIFFILRKKQNQITFLHVYHHTITALFSWCYLKYLPGEQGIVIGTLNSFVHVIMYFYYMVAAMGPEYKKYLWWKKYMTWIQLIQFCLMLTYLGVIIAMDCNLSKTLTFFFVGNVVIFLYLFGKFYLNAYKKKPKVIEHIGSNGSLKSGKLDANNNTKEINKKVN